MAYDTPQVADRMSWLSHVGYMQFCVVEVEEAAMSQDRIADLAMELWSGVHIGPMELETPLEIRSRCI